MDELIGVINRLQDVLSGIGMSTSELIDLPQIAVVGSQSSGKSSVLESFVGKQFLPRGSGLVTRRPLVLQLFQVAQGQPEYGEFLHRPQAKYYNFNDICSEIIADTDRVAGKNAGIVNVPINLRIYSPDVINLTVIDLPGLTKVPVGDQPPDIEIQIRNMINTYILRPNCIILAVTAANTDIANSDALQLAKAADPQGDRTVGVITKIDLMDKGTDARDVLLGKVYPLKRGYIGVVNRSQADINQNKSIKDSLDAERGFFMAHPVYSQMMQMLGTRVLAKTLNKMLTEHIRTTLPDIRQKINDMLNDYEKQAQAVGDYASTAAEQGALLLQALTAFAEDFKDAIDGTMIDIPLNELFGGARITYIFQDIFQDTLDRLNPLEGLSDSDIRHAIRNVAGVTSGVFVPEESFELVVKRQIARLEQPSQECVSLVHDEVRRLVAQCEPPELTTYPMLRMRVLEVANGLIRESLPATQEMVNDLITMELGYVNTDHPDFVGATGAINSMVGQLVESMNEDAKDKDRKPSPHRGPKDDNNWKLFSSKKDAKGNVMQPSSTNSRSITNPRASRNSEELEREANGVKDDNGEEKILPSVPATLRIIDDPTKREQIETQMIRCLLESYFDICRKNISDAVPKTIMCFLVNRCKDLMEQRLLTSLYKEELFSELLEESGDVAAQRAQVHNSLSLLKKAAKVLQEVQL
mmetsp:Transcript_13291/g.21813  ORF Transcript_13291/g.21813 Transcript_13291/m.21813 type:complete len:697 (+) Transcript_13291:164-2254(+)|eukprot:CAMPEP_0184671162 /NCGR_PEP_ID=MMETSP0308-20130426/85338_1 /TAXON_ID=38269 /ORGANISM="Gloeochaete witrockiana, Strain SAG 46.84" /LENGTH=696 /DNA_ID=CAMNT_0027118241 /DNA_START=134 /DNA_END=2224 /DNA_ORIENTATION=+